MDKRNFLHINDDFLHINDYLSIANINIVTFS